MGPLDGEEDWGQPWSDFYLAVFVTGGGGGATWKVNVSWNVDQNCPMVASGSAGSVESAGLAAVEALSNLLNV